ncbi:hypothetical protein [Marinobacter persicus]|uniref:hypothetical protein n=1 Tax=Marinobacter persicus TaxID=930118 RepID=UPI0011606A73|nr:hypothetical protein [Marinobacter persicus]GHD54259.1 hypothetical protein GCM10008110_28590 [Marinobacter persicus]
MQGINFPNSNDNGYDLQYIVVMFAGFLKEVALVEAEREVVEGLKIAAVATGLVVLVLSGLIAGV